jgi:hypothetical protein
MTYNINEIKIRTQWLVLLIVSTAINLINPRNIFTLRLTDDCTFGVQTFAFLFNTTITLLTSFIVYYCAYRKPGTKLLTFILFITPAKCFLLLYLLFKFKTEFHFSYSIIGLQIIPIWRYILDWKMRTINKKHQKYEELNATKRVSANM